MIIVLLFILSLLVGYLFGSIPTAVIISKKFFHKDVRDFGSKNAGGTNAARVMGIKVGVLVIILDILKVLIPMYAIYFIYKAVGFEFYYYSMLICGIGTLFGHCFPVFAHFRGGKAVSCFAAFLFGTSWLLTIVGLLTFFILLFIKKYVSVSSMVTSLVASIVSLIIVILGTNFSMYLDFEADWFYFSFITLSSLFLISRHHENIIRLLDHNENKVHFKHK